MKKVFTFLAMISLFVALGSVDAQMAYASRLALGLGAMAAFALFAWLAGGFNVR